MITKGSLNGYESKSTLFDRVTLASGVAMEIELLATTSTLFSIRPEEGIEYLTPMGGAMVHVHGKEYDQRYIVRVAPAFGVALQGGAEGKPALCLRFREKAGVVATHFRGAAFQAATNFRTLRSGGACGAEYGVPGPCYQYWTGSQMAEKLKEVSEFPNGQGDGAGRSRFLLVTAASGTIELVVLHEEPILLAPGDWVVIPPGTNYHVRVQHTGEAITCLFI